MTFSIVCAWCRKALGTLECETEITETEPVSHSICPECMEIVLRQIDETENHNQDHEPNTH